MNNKTFAAFLSWALIAGLWTMVARAEPGEGNIPTGASVDTSFLPKLWAAKTIPPAAVRRTVHVSAEASNASDDNPGTAAAPLKTLAAALKMARPGTRILLHPGHYREAVTMSRAQSGTAAAPVVIESETPGAAVLTGSDIWTGWAPDGAGGDYSHAWPYKWGVAKDPFAYAGANMKPLGRRSEMVFVNGKLFRQVLERADLAPGAFWVNEVDGRVILRMPQGEDPAHDQIEVSVRPVGIEMGSIWGKLSEPHDWPEYYVLRGLAVEHYTGQHEYGEGAVKACGSHFLLENCRMIWNNACGLILRGRDIVVRRCVFDHNGSSGVSGPPTPVPSMENVLLEDDQTNDNNWRGAMGEFYGFAVAGMKLMTSRNVVIRRFTSARNASPGVWLDNANRNYLIEHCRFLNNTKGSGLWMEISQGPFLVRDCVSAFNTDGVTISNSSHVTLLRDTLYGNTSSQVAEWSPGIDRGGNFDIALTMRDNVIVAADPNQALWRRPDYPNIYATLRSDGNLWYRPGGGGWYIGSEGLDFSGWLTLTKQDGASLCADPRLKDPSGGDFIPRANSPLMARATWGSHTAVTVMPRRAMATPWTFIYMASNEGLPIRYTLDGADPGPNSPLYVGPFHLDRAATIKARAFGPGGGGLVAKGTLVATAPAEPDVSLSDLTPLKNVVGWGGQARKDRSIQDKSLSIDGIPLTHGMGAHAPSELVYDIPADALRFVSVVGVDDEVIGQTDGKSSVAFEVYVDDVKLTQTEVLRVGQVRSIDVALPPGGKRLRLVVTDGGDGNEWDHADWGQAGFRRP